MTPTVSGSAPRPGDRHPAVNIEPRPALIACHRAGEFGYVDAPAVTGVFAAEEPFRVRLELDQLWGRLGQR